MEQKSLPLEKKKVVRTYLNTKENFALAKLIQEEFVTSQMNDTQFSVYAREKLGIAHLSAHHVYHMRTGFDIPPYRAAKKETADKAANLELTAKVALLETRIKGLEDHLSALAKTVQHNDLFNRRLG